MDKNKWYFALIDKVFFIVVSFLIVYVEFLFIQLLG